MLPNNLKYQNKIESASVRDYTSAIQPQNGTGNYWANNTITINIPTSPNSVLVPSESFLKFDIGGVTCGGVASSYLHLDKAGAYGFIQRLRVTHGSQDLENLDNYDPWVGEIKYIGWIEFFLLYIIVCYSKNKSIITIPLAVGTLGFYWSIAPI